MTHISKTTALARVAECVSYSRTMVEASAVYGPPGVGKTTALTAITADDPSVRFISLTSVRRSPLAVWSLIADAMGVYTGQRAAWKIEEIVHSLLQHPDAKELLFVFDEAQNIPYDLLRDIVGWPKAFGVPVVICGNEHILKRTRSTSAAAFDQFDSRIQKRARIGAATREDFDTIAIDFDVFGLDARAACALYGENTSIRSLVSMLEAAKTFAEGGKIGMEELRRAVTFKEGHHALKKLDRKAA